MSALVSALAVEYQKPCAGCVAHGPEFAQGCPKPYDGHPSAGPCDGMGHECECVGIVQGLWTYYACESCYFEQK